ncbi:Kinesin-like protein KIF26A [Hypsibius exemplaris]|uniref:Kinesin-like protein KIF26A n=1 Tax=Hypsibius exemplaris TaxID=2072580 RepID=A0A9X6RNF0_HYPEX|nr:Kinesin-like protein KIF26A [Hypsibius exemplaris]
MASGQSSPQLLPSSSSSSSSSSSDSARKKRRVLEQTTSSINQRNVNASEQRLLNRSGGNNALTSPHPPHHPPPHPPHHPPHPHHHLHYYTNFYELLRRDSPPVPPLLMRNPGKKDIGPGKVKILLRVAGPAEDAGSAWMTIDQRRKQVNLLDPSMMSSGTRSRSALPLAPKMFSFDSIFAPDSTQNEICSAALVDLIQAVVNGVDGCLISYGHSKLGKTYNVVGCDSAVSHAGLIPSAIAWLFRLVEEERHKSPGGAAQFKIRISAVEVSGARETVTDLLADLALDQKPVNGGFACDDPQYSSPLLNPNQLQANNSEEAAQLLDACLATRRQSGSSSSSHMFFTLHLYQYRLDKAGAGGVSGERSHLRLIDLGSNAGEMALSGLGNVILGLINGQIGQKHQPQKESKITQLLKDALSNVSGHTALLCHVSCAPDKYNETLSVVQMASRIHRMRRKRIKTGVGYGSGDSSRMHSSSASSDPSSSEVSAATTVIFCGNRQQPESDGDIRKLTNRIQTNPNLKLLRMPSDANFNTKGAPQSLLTLTHGSPVRRPTMPQMPVSDHIEPVLRPRPLLKPIPEDQSPTTRPVTNPPKHFTISVQQTSTELYDPIPTRPVKVLESRPTSLKVTRQTQARRPPVLGKAAWTENDIDPSKRDMIQKWVELQSPVDDEKGSVSMALQSHPDMPIIPMCDAGQQVSQLQILHETHPAGSDTPASSRPNTDYGISQQDLEDLDALDTLASHLSSQLDLLSVELAESFVDEFETPPELPEPMRPLQTELSVGVWEAKTGTYPRKQTPQTPPQTSLCLTNSLRRRMAPAPPARSSSVPRQTREQLPWSKAGQRSRSSVKIAKPMASPSKSCAVNSAFVAPSPDLSQDSGHDSGFSMPRTVPVQYGKIAAHGVATTNKRSPSQSSSGLGSDGTSSVGSAVGKAPTLVVSDAVTTARGGASSRSTPGSPRRMVLQDIDEEERMKCQTKTLDQIALLRRQHCQLKMELASTQDLLGMDHLGAFANVLVEPSDPHYLPTLRQTTSRLERLVLQLKSRVMLVTCL